MHRLRTVLVWLVAVTLLVAHPVAGLASCRRCPPDCPMHLRGADRADPDAAAAAHAADHGHGSAAGEPRGSGMHAGGAKRCHDAAPRAPEDGPCLAGMCGHMDAAAGPVLPDGVLRAPQPLAATPAALACASAPTLLQGAAPRTPPTEPPRALLA